MDGRLEYQDGGLQLARVSRYIELVVNGLWHVGCLTHGFWVVERVD
jgi:hypothetical protein